MNDENRENDRPVILTIPASLTVPDLGFLVALNPDWCFTRKRGTQTDYRASCRDSSVVRGEEVPFTKGFPNSSETNDPASGVWSG